MAWNEIQVLIFLLQPLPMGDDSDGVDNVLEDVCLAPDELVKDVWATVRLLGRGNFGKVYHMCNIKDGREAALKMENVASPDKCLKIESEVMKKMKNHKGVVQIYDEGARLNYKFILMTLCGWDLTRISEELRNKFSDSTIIRLAIRTLIALKRLHEIGYIHRDLKPCNFALHCDAESFQIYLLDFGMTRQYAFKDSEKKWQIRQRRSVCRFRGTLRYCSINMHKRIELGRGDDLWSWLYMMLELRCPLPWRNSSHPEKVEVLKTMLINNVISKDPVNKVFQPVLTHLQSLTYPDRPNYKMIYELLYAKMTESGIRLTDPMDYGMLQPTTIPELISVQEKYNIPSREKSRMRQTEEEEAEALKLEFEPSSGDVPGGINLEKKFVGDHRHENNNNNMNISMKSPNVVLKTPEALKDSASKRKNKEKEKDSASKRKNKEKEKDSASKRKNKDFGSKRSVKH
ncbi:unnamed protein product [Caenorhabditis auriculariae]|uniref:Protein kinase domain-containing protein n=1 Tax=Caenorhabditis auriculariae TaxID=2777116 RepID=A0A8S1HNT7_9PELO|nr:unnamed protein product [Caenorhabditis auriculariae]